LIVAENPERALIFVNQNDSMQEIAEKLNYHQKETFVMRGNIQKEERKRALDLFRSGKIKLLVSSDLTARGLDIPEVTHIIHLDCPANPNEYLHRAGRTARGYASGKSICIITDKDLSTLKKYQKKFNIQFKEMKVSHGQFIEA
jgi:ATP-dependent RNA helicase DeaD